MAEQTRTYSTVELSWQTVFQAYDESTGILLSVRPHTLGGCTWEAFDGTGDCVASGDIFADGASAQAAAVNWWREQVGQP